MKKVFAITSFLVAMTAIAQAAITLRGDPNYPGIYYKYETTTTAEGVTDNILISSGSASGRWYTIYDTANHPHEVPEEGIINDGINWQVLYDRTKAVPPLGDYSIRSIGGTQ